MSENVNYGGEISLDQLSQITAQQQQQAAVPRTKDGQPAPYVITKDLVGSVGDPLGDFIKDLEANKAPSEPPVKGAKLADPVHVYNPTQNIDMATPVQQQSQYTATKDMKKLDPSEIAPPKVNEAAKAAEEYRNKLITDLDNAIQRDKQEMWDNVVEPLYRQKLEEKMLAEGEGNTDGIIPTDDDFDIDMSADEDTNLDDIGDFGMNDDVKVTLEMGSEPAVIDNDNVEPSHNEQVPVQTVVPAPKSVVVAPTPVQAPINDVSFDQPTKEVDIADTYNSITSSDLDDIFKDDDEDTVDDEVVQAAITEEIKSKIRPISNVINLSEYTVSTKATSGSKVLSQINTTRNSQVGTWVLVNAGRPITMTAMYGDEIEKINPDPDASDLPEFQRQKQIFSIFYDHTVDANKPATLEAWTKTIPASDIPHLYFTAYKATFSDGANYLPRRCLNGGCNNGFLELTALDSMVKYKDDDAKKRIQDILAMDPTSPDLNIKATLYQVSDNLCISVRTPSIYSMVFEDAVLNKQFKTKYSELTTWISCIEDIYVIDHATKQLIKVTYKIEPNNMARTTNNKYKTYAAILKTLSSDQYINAVNKINDIQAQHIDDVSYGLPATSCPKCGTAIPEDPKVNAVVAFFMRHRLQTAMHSSQG